MKRGESTEPDFLLAHVGEDGLDNPDHLRCCACGAAIFIPSPHRSYWGKWRGRWYAHIRQATDDIQTEYRYHARVCFGLKRLILQARKQHDGKTEN